MEPKHFSPIFALLWLYLILPIFCRTTDHQPVRCEGGDSFSHYYNGLPTNVEKDCQKAIEMISPQRKDRVTFDGEDTQWKLNHGNPRLKFLPAVFRFRSCAVLCSMASSAKPPPKHPATAMFFTVWPEVRRAAERITETCLANKGWNGAGGTSWALATVEERLYSVRVVMRAASNSDYVKQRHHSYESNDTTQNVLYTPKSLPWSRGSG
jgi:hypothetical protein